MAKMYYEKDCDLNYLNGKKIAVIGYGSQGHAHALNLKDSGCEVCVGLREGSKNWAQAEAAGLTVKTVAEAAKWGDIVMMLINDEVQADVYKKDIAPYLEEGNALAFAHGFNIRYKQIVPPAGVDVFMAAPKGPGHTVRSTYVSGKGVPCLVAVEQNATGRAYEIALAYIADGTDEEWNGRTERYSGVTNVGARAFKDCRYLTCMFLNDDITTISDSAFYKDEYLSAINMPRKLELIDKYAFYGCDTLTFVRARNCSRLRRIEDHAFYSCTMLAELRLPEGLTYIGPWAFAWDRILGQEDTTLGLPSSLQTISTGAFAFVNHHKNLNIPANVTSIGDFAFMCDYYMNNLTFSPGDKKLTIGKAAFFGDNHMKSVDLSNRVAQIDRCAFAGCEMLEEAYFGDKIDTIEGRAFTSLDNAMKIAVEGVLNGILRPDDTEQNADQAGDISTALNMIAKVTKLKRAVFKNDPAKSIYAAADSNRSFPDDCVVYYPQGSYTWLAELKDDGTWQGYQTGFWHGDHIAAFTDTVVAPTCTEQGYTEHRCVNKAGLPCGEHYIVEGSRTPVLGHDYSGDSGVTTIIEPTCTTTGLKEYHCTRCGDTYTEILSQLGHDYELQADKSKEPDCTQPGSEYYVCGRCKDVKLVRKPALGHDWGDWIVDQQETDQADGLKHRICKTCGERQDAKIPKLEHIHNHLPTKVEPTCEEQGYTRYTCACGDTYIEQSSYVPALGHIWVETARQQPTEKTVGVITYTCQRCAKLRYEYIPKTEPVDKWKNPYRDVRSTAWYYEDVAYVTRNDLMVGTGTMTFSPDGEMSRAMLVTVLYRMNGSPSVAGMTMPFQDVPGDAWYTDAVTWAYNCGVVSGMSPTTFAPMVSITREQMMTMFYGYAVYMDYNTMAVADLSAFPDGGDVSSWAEAEMGWAVANTLISGVKESDGVYLRPQGTATRAEAAAILHRFDQWRVNAVVTGK